MSERTVLGIVLDEVARDHAAWSRAMFGNDIDSAYRGLGAWRSLQFDDLPDHDIKQAAAALLNICAGASYRGFTLMEVVSAARDIVRENKAKLGPKSDEPVHVHDGDHTGGGPVG